MLQANGIVPIAPATSASYNGRHHPDVKPVLKQEVIEIPENDTAEEILALEVSTILYRSRTRLLLSASTSFSAVWQL